MDLIKVIEKEKIIKESIIEPNHEAIKDLAIELLKQKYKIVDLGRPAKHQQHISEIMTELVIQSGKYKVTIETTEVKYG